MPPIKYTETTRKRFWAAIFLLSLFFILAIIALIYQSSRAINWHTSPLFGGGEMMMDSASVVGAPEMMQETSFAPMPPETPTGATPEDRALIGPKIIQNGSLTLRVDDATQRLEDLRGIADKVSGFVENATIQDRAGIKTAQATLRVPVEVIDTTREKIKQLASTVFAESTNAVDVTADYIDLDARLTAAKAEEAQYLEILKQAKTVQDTLNVTSRLAEVRTQIEQLQGQMRYLSDRTDYATIQVTMTEEARVEAPTRIWKPGETFRAAVQGLVITLQGTVDALIAASVFLIGLLLPIFIVLGILTWLVLFFVRKFFSKIRRS